MHWRVVPPPTFATCMGNNQIIGWVPQQHDSRADSRDRPAGIMLQHLIAKHGSMLVGGEQLVTGVSYCLGGLMHKGLKGCTLWYVGPMLGTAWLGTCWWRLNSAHP